MRWLILAMALILASPHFSTADTARVKVTAYLHNNQPTASGMKVREGILAVSRDLEKKGWTFGKSVLIEGLGIYVIADRMHTRMRMHLDVWVPSMDRAKNIGMLIADAHLVP